MKENFKPNQDSEITLTELMLPSYANFSGKIHGGFILSLMDKAAFACASKFSGHYCVTASVNRVDFLNPIEVGELVTLQAKINYVGNSSMVVGIRVTSQNIQTGKVKHCNSSYFAMVAKNEAGKNVKVPGLILKDENDLRRFLRSIKQLKMRKQRDIEFKKEEFSKKDFSNYKKLLENYNVNLEL